MEQESTKKVVVVEEEEEAPPSFFVTWTVRLAWLVLFTSATVYVLSTTHTALVDGVTRKVLKAYGPQPSPYVRKAARLPAASND